MNCLNFHAHFIRFICRLILSGIVPKSSSSRVWASNEYTRFPSAHIYTHTRTTCTHSLSFSFSLSCITMEVSQTEFASAVHHIVNARRFLSRLLASLSSASRRNLPFLVYRLSLSPILSVRETRLYSSYFLREWRSVPLRYIYIYIVRCPLIRRTFFIPLFPFVFSARSFPRPLRRVVGKIRPRRTLPSPFCGPTAFSRRQYLKRAH